MWLAHWIIFSVCVLGSWRNKQLANMNHQTRLFMLFLYTIPMLNIVMFAVLWSDWVKYSVDDKIIGSNPLPPSNKPVHPPNPPSL